MFSFALNHIFCIHGSTSAPIEGWRPSASVNHSPLSLWARHESAAERDHRHWSLATSLQRVLNLSAKGELPGFSTSRQRENGVTFRDAASFQRGRMETLVEDQHFAIFPLRRQHCHLLARAEERELERCARSAQLGCLMCLRVKRRVMLGIEPRTSG